MTMERHFEGRELTRGRFLNRAMSFGVVATAGAGLSSLLGASPAHASATHAHEQGLPTQGQLVPGVMTQSTSPDCNYCITCNRDENTCSPGGCGSGNCCYHCTGCGYNYHSCYDVPCTILSFKTCP